MQVTAYGIPADYSDGYLRIGKDAIESVWNFTKVVI
jgi:hypothetical protein